MKCTMYSNPCTEMRWADMVLCILHDHIWPGHHCLVCQAKPGFPHFADDLNCLKGTTSMISVKAARGWAHFQAFWHQTLLTTNIIYWHLPLHICRIWNLNCQCIWWFCLWLCAPSSTGIDLQAWKQFFSKAPQLSKCVETQRKAFWIGLFKLEAWSSEAFGISNTESIWKNLNGIFCIILHYFTKKNAKKCNLEQIVQIFPIMQFETHKVICNA